MAGTVMTKSVHVYIYIWMFIYTYIYIYIYTAPAFEWLMPPLAHPVMRCNLAFISYEADVFISSRRYSIIAGSARWVQSDMWLSCIGGKWHYNPVDGKYPWSTWHYNLVDGNYPSLMWGSPLMPHIGQSTKASSHGHFFHVTSPVCMDRLLVYS